MLFSNINLDDKTLIKNDKVIIIPIKIMAVLVKGDTGVLLVAF